MNLFRRICGLRVRLRRRRRQIHLPGGQAPGHQRGHLEHGLHHAQLRRRPSQGRLEPGRQQRLPSTRTGKFQLGRLPSLVYHPPFSLSLSL